MFFEILKLKTFSVKGSNSAFTQLLEIKEHYNTAVYIEYHGDNKENVFSMLMKSVEIMAQCEGNENDTWVATNPRDMSKYYNNYIFKE